MKEDKLNFILIISSISILPIGFFIELLFFNKTLWPILISACILYIGAFIIYRLKNILFKE